MPTGIPLLDSIISGVSSAADTVSNLISNISQNISNTTVDAQNTLGQFLTGIQNGIGGTVSGVANSVLPGVISYTPSTYTPVQYSTPAYTPAPVIGQALQAPGTTYFPSPSSAFASAYPGSLPSVTNNFTLAGLDFNSIYAAVNAAFQNLPSIVQTIQNPLNSPLFGTLMTLVQNLYDQQAQTVQTFQNFVSNAESNIYASTSNVLSSIGIDVGNWGNLLDATVRSVMNTIGYNQTNQYEAIMRMVQQGNADQQNQIEKVQEGLIKFGTYIQDAIGQNSAVIQALTGAGNVDTTQQRKDFATSLIDTAGRELQRVLVEAIKYAEENPNSFIQQFSSRVDNLSGVIDNLKAGKYRSSQEFFNAVFGNEPATGLARGLIILASVIPTLISAVNAAGVPTLEAFTQLVNEDSPVKLLSPSDYITMFYKGVVGYDYLKDKFGKLGISEENMVGLLNASLTDPDFGTMIQAKRRGFITDKQWKDYTFDQRLPPDMVGVIEQVMNVLPNPQDLTRIADKRIWSGQTPPQYGQYAELPDQYREYMKQQGYDPQFTEWFWAAHWNLPSPNQIFEMYQRHVINQEDMQVYLNLTDWLPFFRDKLLAISYNPLTRVDIRRMYGLGMFTYDELISRYEAIGFSPQDAKLMADFTVKFSSEDSQSKMEKLKDKIVTAVQRMYVQDKLSRDETLNRLVNLGEDRQVSELTLNWLEFEKIAEQSAAKIETYKTRAINLIIKNYKIANIGYTEALNSLVEAGLTHDIALEELKYAELERKIQTKSDIITMYETRYVNGVDDQSTFISNLSMAGLNTSEVNQELTEAELKLEKRFKMPSERQVKEWYINGTVGYDFILPYLKALGYPESIIPLVLAGDYPPLGA